MSLQRTADNSHTRLRGEEDEIVGGFPKTREELFKYRGLIIGSVEAGLFTGDQLQMIADFVDRRGGGLLVLGGPRSLAEGGYGGTPVADALPLVIDPRTRASEPAPLARLKVSPTRADRPTPPPNSCRPRPRRSPAGTSCRSSAVNAPLTAKPGRDGAAERDR